MEGSQGMNQTVLERIFCFFQPQAEGLQETPFCTVMGWKVCGCFIMKCQHTHTHTFTFSFTFHRCYSNEVELNVKLVNIIQHNTKFDCTIQSCYSPSAMYSLQYGYYTLLQIFVSKILCTYIMLSQLYLLLFVIFPSLKFELFFIGIT